MSLLKFGSCFTMENSVEESASREIRITRFLFMVNNPFVSILGYIHYSNISLLSKWAKCIKKKFFLYVLYKVTILNEYI